jgi:hypothetical protein
MSLPLVNACLNGTSFVLLLRWPGGDQVRRSASCTSV